MVNGNDAHTSRSTPCIANSGDHWLYYARSSNLRYCASCLAGYSFMPLVRCYIGVRNVCTNPAPHRSTKFLVALSSLIAMERRAFRCSQGLGVVMRLATFAKSIEWPFQLQSILRYRFSIGDKRDDPLLFKNGTCTPHVWVPPADPF